MTNPIIDKYAQSLEEAMASLTKVLELIRTFADEPSEAVVVVPGQMRARYLHGAITGWIFSPSEADAGYFGEGTYVLEGDEELDVKDQDGPFWNAVRDTLNGDRSEFTVRWEC